MVQRERLRPAVVVAAWTLAIAAVPLVAEQGGGKSAPGAKSSQRRDFVAEGVAHHDAGRYDDAIASYRKALEVDPSDAVARYELAFAYGAKKDYARCLETARDGLRDPGPYEARFFTTAGNCLDDWGRSGEAIATYRQGLAKHPRDARLHYNLAVSLWRYHEHEEAVAEALATIDVDPSYASAYTLVGVIEDSRERDLHALFAMLRSLMVDAESERSREAATLALDLFQQGITTKPGKEGRKVDVDVAVSPRDLEAGGLHAALAVSRSMTAASIHGNETAGSQAGKLAAALATYLAIASELAAKPDHAAASREAQWRLIAAPLLTLHERKVATTFGFLVADRGGVPGAAEWLQANGDAMRQLDAAMKTAAAPAP